MVAKGATKAPHRGRSCERLAPLLPQVPRGQVLLGRLANRRRVTTRWPPVKALVREIVDVKVTYLAKLCSELLASGGERLACIAREKAGKTSHVESLSAPSTIHVYMNIGCIGLQDDDGKTAPAAALVRAKGPSRPIAVDGDETLGVLAAGASVRPASLSELLRRLHEIVLRMSPRSGRDSTQPKCGA